MPDPFIVPGDPDIIFLSGDPGDRFLKQVMEPVLESRDDIPKAHEGRRCIKPPMGCGKVITDEEFARYTMADAKEYSMSGWCLSCQDKIFKDPDESEECPPGCTHELDPTTGVDPEGCLCSCGNPCCEVDIGVGIMTCQSYHCRIHGGSADEETD